MGNFSLFLRLSFIDFFGFDNNVSYIGIGYSNTLGGKIFFSQNTYIDMYFGCIRIWSRLFITALVEDCMFFNC